MTKVYEYEFEIGSIVYCKTDVEQVPMQVIKHVLSVNGLVYQCAVISDMNEYFSFELSHYRNMELVKNHQED
jgi:hypothetical protein